MQNCTEIHSERKSFEKRQYNEEKCTEIDQYIANKQPNRHVYL